MTNYSKRIFEMLVRVLVFRSTYAELFAKDSQTDQFLQKVDAACKKISAQSTMQASGGNAVRRSSNERTAAREELRGILESVSRTAVAMGSKDFVITRDKSDRAIADAGRVFVKLAEPLKSEFLANHLYSDFLDRLRSAVDRIERSIEQQAASKGVRKAATMAIAAAQAEALAALARLDPIMANLLADNPPLKSVWDAARRIEKAPSFKKPTRKEEGASQPPLPPSSPPPSSANVIPA